MIPVQIISRAEYDYVVGRGGEPLIDYKNFALDINLRVELQRELFGSDIPTANARFYRWVWDHKPHWCEETLRPLHNFSASLCSHILTRGAHPEMAHDPRNVNILCFDMHQRWENGDRRGMRIYESNMRIIEMLRKEYQKLN